VSCWRNSLSRQNADGDTEASSLQGRQLGDQASIESRPSALAGLVKLWYLKAASRLVGVESQADVLVSETPSVPGIDRTRKAWSRPPSQRVPGLHPQNPGSGGSREGQVGLKNVAGSSRLPQPGGPEDQRIWLIVCQTGLELRPLGRPDQCLCRSLTTLVCRGLPCGQSEFINRESVCRRVKTGAAVALAKPEHPLGSKHVWPAACLSEKSVKSGVDQKGASAA